ncbi:N-acetylmuramoyl-L-alanine amidase [Pseudooceanicola nitratireducens]|uniref:N-acetylmuramoyl-L-alanine amidase n=1 Tax=Pseudooceanicola nitratireducens TaxID=517719 RepID=UPI003C7DFA62
MVVLHHTAMATALAARDRLCDPDPGAGLSPVSCHYVISETGDLWQLVDENDRAWHAGAGAWGAVWDVNSHSIGIELANTSAHPYPEPQMVTLEALLPGLLSRWSIPPERVIGHSDMAPDRKSDPGPRFDWRRLALRGLSIWPGASTGEARTSGRDEQRFCEDLKTIGYLPPEGAGLDLMLRVFRMRFRPWAEGQDLSAQDCRIAADLAARFPVDRGIR